MAERKQPGRLATKVAKAAREAREQGNVLVPMCPSRGVLEHVTSRWGVLVLVCLLEDTHRFSELRRKVGVSEKMLAQTLHALEQDGFVLREAYAVIPPRVDYSLTPLGREVAERVESLVDWIEDNLARVLEARGEHAADKEAS
ncbi:winged helix-turn-helix transcriptional regulator [Cystobacter fuscus]